MVDLIVCGHGRFATGLVSALELIFGPQDFIDAVEFAAGETKTELDAKMAAAFDRHAGADGILVLCDVLQGSPFQAAVAQAQVRDGARVVFGANVAMLLECAARVMAGAADVDELVATALDTGRAQIGVFEASAAPEDDDWE